MFETRTTDELVRIALAGGGFELNAATRTTEDLVRIALATSTVGAKVSFSGLNTRPTDEIVRISLAGRGNISFTA